MTDLQAARIQAYPEYKDTQIYWLKKIPSHWKLLPGRAIYSFQKSPNQGMKESQVLSLSYGKIRTRGEEELHGLVPESFETYQVIQPGDIICRPTDLQNDWNSLRFGISRDTGIITSAYFCIRTRPGVHREYTHRLLHAYDLNKVFYGLGSGLRQNLSWEDFKHLPCAVPPLDEQTAIVRYLDESDEKIQAYISAKERLIALLEEQRQAIIHQAVTRGLDPKVKLKPSGVEWLGDIPEHWERTRLKRVATIQAGITLGKEYKGEELIERPYLRVANVQSGHLDLSEITTVRVTQAEIHRTTLQIGDVLMTEGGDIDKLGRGCMWLGEVEGCLHQNHVFAVRPYRENLDPSFLMALMETAHGRNYFYSTAKQTTNLAATNRTTLGEFPMYLPEVGEQQTIADYILAKGEEQTNAIRRARRQIELMEEYRTRLIADVVTGKLDVRNATP